jgi:hypothetical protein
MVLFCVEEGKMSVSKEAYLGFNVEEGFCGIEFTEDVMVLIKWSSVTDGDILVDDSGALFDVLEVAQVAFLEILLGPEDGRSGNGIECFDIVNLRDGFVVVSPDDGDRLEELDLLDDFVRRGAVSDHIPEKQEMIDLSSPGKFQYCEKGF